jgi:hypothetical protein
MRTFLSIPFFLVGLALHLTTLYVSFGSIRERVRSGSLARRSGIPVLGPLLISFGFSLTHFEIRHWATWVPWCLEALAFAFTLVLRTTPKIRPLRPGPGEIPVPNRFPTQDECPLCGGAMRQTDKNTFTGEVWREFTCRQCGHVVDVNEGEALWHVLHQASQDAKDQKEKK